MDVAEQLAGLLFDEPTHRYSLGGHWVPGVTRVLETAGYFDYSYLGERREVYLDRGRDVHAATHDDDEGRLAEGAFSDYIMGFVEGWRAFRRDYGFAPGRIEQIVCNRQYQYAGRLDRTGRLRDGTEVILDIKSGIAPEAVAYQLAAYAACLPHPRSRRRRCVELHADGTYRVIGFETRHYQRDFEKFLWALSVHQEKNR